MATANMLQTRALFLVLGVALHPEIMFVASRLHRLMRIVRILRQQGYPTVHGLCDALQVKERTIFNDLKELKEDLGVDVQFDKVRKGYFLRSDNTHLGFQPLSEENVYYLLAICRLASAHGAADLVAPLEEFLDHGMRRYLGYSNESASAIVRSEGDAVAIIDSKLFAQLCRACSSSKSVNIDAIIPGFDNDAEPLLLLGVVPEYIVVSSKAWRLVYRHAESRISREIELSHIRKCTP